MVKSPSIIALIRRVRGTHFKKGVLLINHFAKDPLKMGLFAKKMQSANRVKAYRDTKEGGEKEKAPKSPHYWIANYTLCTHCAAVLLQ